MTETLKRRTAIALANGRVVVDDAPVEHVHHAPTRQVFVPHEPGIVSIVILLGI